MNGTHDLGWTVLRQTMIALAIKFLQYITMQALRR